MWLDGKYYVSLDTEFITCNLTETGLISFGLATEHNRFYAVNGDMDTTLKGLSPESREWLIANVWRHLPGGHPLKFDRSHADVMTHAAIARNVEEFFSTVLEEVQHDIDRVVLVAHCGAQDMIRLHGLWNHDWSVMPRSIPNWFRDIKDMRLGAHMRSDHLPEQEPDTTHHALHDAVHELANVRFIVENDPTRVEVL